jgi:hypothetical protein
LNPDEGVKDAAEGLEDWLGLKGWGLSIENVTNND